MTHKYFYIEESDSLLSESSPMFIVMIGTTRQDNRDYLFLMSHAVSKGHYFEIWNRKTAIFVNNILKNYPNAKSRIKQISAREMVRHVKECTDIPYSQNQLRNSIHMQMTIDTYFRVTSNLNSKRNG